MNPIGFEFFKRFPTWEKTKNPEFYTWKKVFQEEWIKKVSLVFILRSLTKFIGGKPQV